LSQGRGTLAWYRFLLNEAISSAQGLGLHRLGKVQPAQDVRASDCVSLEIGVRIWSYLCAKDWSLAGTNGLTYRIHPLQTTTRMPLNASDEHLKSDIIREQPRNTWTEASYVIAHFQLTECAKSASRCEAVDENIVERVDSVIRPSLPSFRGLSEENRRRAVVRIRSYIQDLPAFFQLGITSASSPEMTAQRRLLIDETVALFEARRHSSRSV
ncbi:hypothetical protein FA10DRAFT_291804, partial [Acaromyces ingoldii]